MKQARNREEIEDFLASSSKTVFFFEADWCGDCRYIKPYLPQIEAENPHLTFISVDRDDFMDSHDIKADRYIAAKKYTIKKASKIGNKHE